MAAVLAATGVVVGSETAGADAVSGGGDYISLTTGTRVMDTRDPVVGVPKAGKLQKETPTTIQVTGVGSVPATGVTAVMATVSVLGPTEGMVLRIWPSDGTKSADSVIHSLAANANLSTTSALPVSADGRVTVENSAGEVNVILDVQGYFTTATSSSSGAGGFVPVTQTRMVDTRNGTGTTQATIAAGGNRTITIPTTLVPTTASAVYVNVYVAGATATGTLFLAPGTATTGGNAFNYLSGNTSSGLSAKLSGGKFTVRNSTGAAAVNVVIDVFGYWTGSATTGAGYRLSNSGRLYDTRSGTSPQPLAAGASADVQVGGANGLPVENVAAALLNVHVAATGDVGSTLPVKAWPTGTTEPATAVTNGIASATRSNMAPVKPGTDGKVTIKNVSGAAVNVYVELEGWFADPLPQLDVESNSRTAAFQATGADSSVPGPIELSFTNNAGQLVHAHIPDPEILNAGDTEYTTISDGETFTGTPLMLQQPNRLLSIVGRRTNALSWDKVQTSAATGAWPSSWTALGGSISSTPSGGRVADGRIVQFGVNSTGALWAQTQTAANGSFGPWTKLVNTTLAEAPTVVTDASGGMQLFARTTAGTIVVTPYTPGVAITSWTSLGKPSADALDARATPQVAVFKDRLRVFVTLADGTVMTQLQDLGGAWPKTYQEVPGLKAAGPVAAVVEPVDGTAQVFARSADGYLAWTAEVTKASSTWTSWKVFLNKLATDPTPLRWNDTQMARFGMIARIPNGNTQIVDFSEATKPDLASAKSARKAVEPTPTDDRDGTPTFFDLGQPE
ncbi:hypothetical protein JCM9957A_53540 [Kineosporia succinea]|uniref:hypothetical protein n=1 Tax=Kineosporia succinea TaxID=84632 RepID=UPI0027D7ACC0|nr:hypothetical protein [Kineosporia succinea]